MLLFRRDWHDRHNWRVVSSNFFSSLIDSITTVPSLEHGSRIFSKLALACCCLMVCNVVTAQAESNKISLAYLGIEQRYKAPLSLLDVIEKSKRGDVGLAGFQLAINDNNTTGTFLNQEYSIAEHWIQKDSYSEKEDVNSEGNDPLVDAFDQSLALADFQPINTAALDAVLSDIKAAVVVVDLPAKVFLQVSLHPLMQDKLLLNVRSKEMQLRERACMANVLHIMPDRIMLTDALAQYLAVKKVNRWLLVTGKTEADKAYASAVTYSANKYRHKIVQENQWRFEYGGRLADSGHVTASQEVPIMTQGPVHDVIIAADEDDNFGEYLLYQAFSPRPVMGTQGLVPTAWTLTQELWGSTQLQRRFVALAGRNMTPRDYTAWLAGRSIGEVFTRKQDIENSLSAIREYMLGDDFEVAAFKGEPLTFRRWNGQLRQPILLSGPRMLVGVSPQQGFLHQVSLLDTLGLDEPETQCKNFK